MSIVLQFRRPMGVLERLQREERRAEHEEKRLRDAAWSLTNTKRMTTYGESQLRAAAALIGHEGPLGFAARAAVAELHRRGLPV